MAWRGRGRPRGAATRSRGVRAAWRERLPTATSLQQWLNGALLLCALALLLLAGERAWQRLLELPVGRIAVSGKLENLQRDEVRRVVAEGLDGGFVGTDLAALQDRLEALPWVYAAGVRRRWPDTLEIEVVEQLPIARWGDSGFLNHEATLFRTRSAERRADLPTLDGPAGSEQRLMDHYQRLRDLLAPLDLAVTGLRQDARGQLEADLDTGLLLRLGDGAFLLRVRRFMDLYRAELRSREQAVAVVDMRYARGAAVTFRETEQLAAVSADGER